MLIGFSTMNCIRIGMHKMVERIPQPHPDSASNLVRCAKLRIDKSREYRQAIENIEFNPGLKSENLT